MNTSRAALWQEILQLSPLCSGTLHEQYLTCGKAACGCHDPHRPRRHGPYYLWSRRISGKQINRTLRPGAELERVKKGITNFQRLQEVLGRVLQEEERAVLSEERAAEEGGKKNFKRRLLKRSINT